MKELIIAEDMEVIKPATKENLETKELWDEYHTKMETMTRLQQQAIDLHLRNKGDSAADIVIEKELDLEIERLSKRCDEIHKEITEREIKQFREYKQDEMVNIHVDKKFEKN